MSANFGAFDCFGLCRICYRYMDKQCLHSIGSDKL